MEEHLSGKVYENKERQNSWKLVEFKEVPGGDTRMCRAAR
jgi:hypothetical protein